MAKSWRSCRSPSGPLRGSWRHTADRIWALGFFRSRGGFAAGQLRLLALPVRGTLDDQLVEIGGLHDVQRLEGEIVGKALCGKPRRASAPGS
jgi:hypothetical protein